MYALYSLTRAKADISSSSKNINSTPYLPDYLSISYDYATGNFNMPIV